eukprot:jgi/Picre1/29033/NNA_004427.t1
MEGFQLVTEAKVLGITVYHGTAPPTVDWESKLNSMATTAKVIKANRISSFGKFRLWNTFVISRILYAAEFARVPQEVLRQITKLTRELLPDNARCWSTTRMSAPPQEGGLGCLNFAAHTQARQAKWCLRLLCVPLRNCGRSWCGMPSFYTHMMLKLPPPSACASAHCHQ